MKYKGLIKRLMIQGKTFEEAQKSAEKQAADLENYYSNYFSKKTGENQNG